jgi:hypothetical protein
MPTMINLDVLHEHLSHAKVVFDAAIAADRLSTSELRSLMHVALNLIEDAEEILRCPPR